ncbi:MAG: hypothetical protein KDA91_11525 [Planctomycetaceae bacterium]|nr:hypothetical protein [Planctomycetaceae bacterium]
MFRIANPGRQAKGSSTDWQLVDSGVNPDSKHSDTITPDCGANLDG